MNLTVTVALTIDSYDSVLVGPRLQDVATGGIGDPFILLPGVLWCWVSFARAFLLALPREASLVALTELKTQAPRSAARETPFIIRLAWTLDFDF